MDKKKIGILIAILVVLIGLGAGVYIYFQGDHSGPSVTLVSDFETDYGETIGLYDLVRSVSDDSAYEIAITDGGDVSADGLSTVFEEAGSYTVEITAVDEYANTTVKTAAVTILDSTPPTITASDITISLGDSVDYHTGVTASDEMDGNLTGQLQVDTSQVDETTAGVYPVIYTVTDSSGNEAVLRIALTIQNPEAKSVTLSQQSLSLDGNGHYQLTATVSPSNWTGNIVWTSSNTDVAVVSDGLVSWVGVGSCTITATAGSASAQCQVTCGYVSVTSLALSASELELDYQMSETLTATVIPSNWSGSVIWTTSDAAVATVTDGIVTWVGQGSCTITATAGSASAQCQVTCGYVSVTSLALSASELELDYQMSETLTATVIPSNWSGSVIWTTSDAAVATVTDGIVTWVGQGSCIITASADGRTASCAVTCNQPEIESIEIEEESLTLAANKTYTLTSVITPSDWVGIVTWSTSDTSVATVSNGVVTWVGEGSCTISVTAGECTDSVEVTCEAETSIWDEIFGIGDEDDEDTDNAG
ncbi:MAG: Ig-like domain-containing protein [Clostridiales bacterium]|nr:Ig-like domain-containing protein [Clostridiales bacterium]